MNNVPRGEVDIRASMLSHITKHLKQAQVMVVAGVLARIFLLVPSAGAVDALKTCGCLLKECRVELAKCIANPSCAANVACLQTCNNRPDETECQIKCGDLFGNRVVDEFMNVLSLVRNVSLKSQMLVNSQHQILPHLSNLH